MDVKKYVIALSLFALVNTAVFATTAEGEEAYNQEHYEKAYMLLSPEAEKGDAKAQYLIGKMYYNAQGVTFSPEKT